MDLGNLQEQWNALGHDDPLWAILSDPDKRGGGWETDDFFATGRADISDLLDQLRADGCDPPRGRALDFGCGVGRLTQALADHFDRCDGVDVAASMVERAQALNASARCVFRLNETSDLSAFPDRSFDFVLSLLVLQHMEPGLMRSYLAEFVRVLRPDGVAVFNIPEGFTLGTELSPDARRAELAVREDPARLTARSVIALPLAVSNRGGATWPASARVTVGNHWLDAGGALLTLDDGRAILDADLAPGETREIELTVTAPHQAGSYLLELDLVQEQRGWFGDSGSPTLRVPVTVLAESGAEKPDSDDQIVVPRIEMHALSRAEVVAVVRRAGGAVLRMTPRERCGPDVPSVDYVISRSPVPLRYREANPEAFLLGTASLEDGLVPTVRASSPALRRARAELRSLVDVHSFPMASRRPAIGALTTAARRLLRRGLLEPLHRQTEFNRASVTVIEDLERRVDELQSGLAARDAALTAATRRIDELERQAEPGAGAGRAAPATPSSG